MLDLLHWLVNEKSVVMLDGGMGTMLAEAGWHPPFLPEEMNLSAPESVRGIHEAYVAAGAKVIETNTFGGSAIKLGHRNLQNQAREINRRAAEIACKASGGRALVAGSIGPIGRLVDPLGDLGFDEAVEAFLPQVKGLREGGADFFLVETMLDLREAKAAVMAIREEGGHLPFVVSFTFDRNGCTMTGTPPEVAMAWAMAVGASGVGANCGVGPQAYVDTVRRLKQSGDLPVFVYPNAGIPSAGDWLEPEAFAEACLPLAEAGASVIGGCCGTTPGHTRAMAKILAAMQTVPAARLSETLLASRTQVSSCGPGRPLLVVGERVNPSRKGPLRDAMLCGDWGPVREESRLQTEAGAAVIDINGGIPGLDRQALMASILRAVEGSTALPVSIDSDDSLVLESISRSIAGVPLLNSVTCEADALERGLGIARRNGAGIVVLTLDRKGIPADSKGRLELAARAVEAADSIGFPRRYLFIDPLTLALGAEEESARVTLEALRGLREMGTRSILGISNISFGLPNRGLLNRTFLAMAMAAGLEAVIANPLDTALMSCIEAAGALTGRDPGMKTYIGASRRREEAPTPQKAVKPPTLPGIAESILRGEKDAALSAGEAFLERAGTPMALIQDNVLPALEDVGNLYECGDYFLPQLLASSEAAQAVCRLAEERLLAGGQNFESRGTVLLATVEGDLHDLGKNVVGMVLKSRGYKVVDMGKDMPAERILEVAETEKADIVGLSALMTTTVERMGEVVSLGKERGMPCRFILGGAAVSALFAEKVGADGFALDAVEAARLVDRLMGEKRKEA